VASGGDVSARVFEAPGFERSFERPLGIGPLDARTADVLAPTLRLLVDTLRVLERALVAPIQCALGLVSVTGEGRFQRARTPGLREWIIEAPPPRHMPRPPSDWPLKSEAPELTAAALEQWIRRALAEPSPDGTFTWFDRLAAAETRVRLPAALAADAISLERTGIRVPVERRADGTAWVAGAHGSTYEPPMRLVFEIRDESTFLSLDFCWSLWTDPGSPGRALVDGMAGDLAALGWEDLGWEDEEPAAPAAGPPAETVDGGRIAVGPRLRAGANQEVCVGWLAADPSTRFLVTLTDSHPEPRASLARRLAFPFAGVAALEVIAAPDPPMMYDDALVERLPPGRPASELSPLPERALAAIGAQVARILVPVHGAGQHLLGIHPDLVYIDEGGDGLPHVTGLAPRGPVFVASARAPARGISCYQLPYIGPELVTGNTPEPRTDVFALCATLHQLGTGAHPFGTLAELPALIQRIASGRPDPWPGGGRFGELLARGLAHEVAARPTAAELAAAFDPLA
jgi:hypothetical protein